MKQKLISFMHENKGFFLFLVLMVVFRSSLADWNVVPSGSMQPTIVEGDRILINKLAYDFRLPLSGTPLIRFANPERGDIIVFESKVSDKRLVKRVIGMPGDIVEMHNNVLTINGTTLGYQQINQNGQAWDLHEDLLGLPHQVRLNPMGSASSNFAPLTIPFDRYLALGDNRDNSADSRVIGLIPRDEIIGRSRSVVMSLNYDNHYIPRKERFFKKLF